MKQESQIDIMIHVVAVALVMSLVGIALLAFVHSFSLSKKLKTQTPISIQLNAEYNKDSLKTLSEWLKAKTHISPESVQLVTKEVALSEMKNDPDLKINLTADENPFFDVLLFQFKTGPKPSNAINEIQEYLKTQSIVTQPIQLLDVNPSADQSIQNASNVLIFTTLILTLLAFLIIGYLVKMYILSKDSLIRLMFNLGTPIEKIIKPYIRISIIHGLASAFLSIVFVGLSLLVFFYLSPWIYNLLELKNFMLVMLVLLIIGPTLHAIVVRRHINILLNQ
jgi:cell division protein FtsX